MNLQTHSELKPFIKIDDIKNIEAELKKKRVSELKRYLNIAKKNNDPWKKAEKGLMQVC